LLDVFYTVVGERTLQCHRDGYFARTAGEPRPRPSAPAPDAPDTAEMVSQWSTTSHPAALRNDRERSTPTDRAVAGGLVLLLPVGFAQRILDIAGFAALGHVRAGYPPPAGWRSPAPAGPGRRSACDRGHPSRRGRQVKESSGKTENPPHMLALGPFTVNGMEHRLRLSAVVLRVKRDLE
jgi:hypothetical protein